MFRVYAITYKRETIGIAHVVGNMRMTKSDAAEAFWNDPHVNKTRDESHIQDWQEPYIIISVDELPIQQTQVLFGSDGVYS